MLNSGLIKILKSFSPQEIKEFREFIASPFFNKNENLSKLYDYLRKFYPEFDDKKLKKEYVYKRLYNKEKYNDGFMRNVIFDLSKLAENYLTYINVNNDKLRRGISLLDELNKRKLEKFFLKNYDEVNEENENTIYQSSNYFYNKFLLQSQMEVFISWCKSEKTDPHRKSVFKHIYENLTCYYLNHVLKEYRYWTHRQYLNKEVFHSDFFDYIISYLSDKDNFYKEKPLIKLHLHEILLQKERSIEDFKILKEILINEVKTLNHTDRYSLHNILQIFCTEKIFEGDSDFRKERFELFKIALEQKLFYAAEHKYISEIFFYNIVMTGIALKEFDWVEKFIEDHENILSPEVKEVTLNFSLARLNFGKTNYNEALNYLNMISSDKNVTFKTTIRELTLMTYYELNSFNQIFYQIDTYRHFLSKVKASYTKDSYERINNFLICLTKLVRLKEKMNTGKLNKLKHYLENNTNTNERTWLLKKINELR